MKIAVAGATGRVGKHIVDILKGSGHSVIPISRSTGVDVITGEGLVKALAGVECLVDAAAGSSPAQQEATAFFTTAAKNLQEAGERAGVQRIIVVSIIGIDRFSSGYMAAKVAHERAYLSGLIPSGIVRAAQFHEFVEEIMEWGRQGDTCYVPKMQTQLVAARTVAEQLAARAIGPELIKAPRLEVAGPRAENLVDAAARLVRRRGQSVRIEAVSNPADPELALYESGALLPGPNVTLAGPTFDEWLEATYPVQTKMASG